ncbi:putative four-helix membrane protein [Acinetobacter thermotolerans]|uniref:putative four-helix membrane protein n=1 Tax=Acinetobacter thermotolerans TaxID=3151487 RepID=UPI00325AA6D0
MIANYLFLIKIGVMMIQKIIVTPLIFLSSTYVFADRFIEDGVGSSSGGIFNAILGVILMIAALYYFFTSYVDWSERQKKGEKPKPKNDLGEWIPALIGYALVSIFAFIPIMFIVRIFGSAEFVREYWYFIYLSCFGLLTFLRRT